jgi:hypothetical protein
VRYVIYICIYIYDVSRLRVKKHWKEVDISEFQVLSRHFPAVTVESLRNVTQDSRFLRRELNSRFPGYQAE